MNANTNKPVTNGKFFTYTAAYSVLLAMVGGLIALSWHLVEQAQIDQDTRIATMERKLGYEAERVAALEVAVKNCGK